MRLDTQCGLGGQPMSLDRDRIRQVESSSRWVRALPIAANLSQMREGERMRNTCEILATTVRSVGRRRPRQYGLGQVRAAAELEGMPLTRSGPPFPLEPGVTTMTGDRRSARGRSARRVGKPMCKHLGAAHHRDSVKVTGEQNDESGGAAAKNESALKASRNRKPDADPFRRDPRLTARRGYQEVQPPSIARMCPVTERARSEAR